MRKRPEKDIESDRHLLIDDMVRPPYFLTGKVNIERKDDGLNSR